MDAGEQDKTFIVGISGEKLGYLPGDMVDNAYLLKKLIGRGGMGAIFQCFHQGLDRTYAIKILAANDLSSEAWSRFQSEAQSLAKLRHPGIVAIYNMGIDKNQCPYFVMDYIDGKSLADIIGAGERVSVAQIVDIFIQVCDALSSAHSQGIIHRDLKPSNIMLIKNGSRYRAILVDFGIARVSHKNSAAQSQTATGLIFGTPFYMSPEQCEGLRVDERSDIYSLGCTLFEALTGRPPFVGESAFHTFLMHQNADIPALADCAPGRDFAPPLESALHKMLAKKPEGRYQTIKQVMLDLERLKAGKTIQPQMTRPMTVLSQDEDQLAHDASDRQEKKPAGFNKKIVLAAVVILAIPLMVLPMLHPQKKVVEQTSNTEPDEPVAPFAQMIYPKEELKKFGASNEELNDTTEDQIAEVDGVRKSAMDILKKKCTDKNWTSKKFRKGAYLDFPTDVTIGDIAINNRQTVAASGEIYAPLDQDAWLYTNTGCTHCLQIVDKFGPDDLTGLALVSWLPEELTPRLKKMQSWKRLKDLWFFNPLLKTITFKTENWAETNVSPSDFPVLNSFDHLRSLGLCYPLTGEQIKGLPILKRISCLALERVPDFDVLLKNLPALTNLQELFLMNQNTSDQDLAILAQMPNLRKLTILRGHLTIQSLRYFKTFPALKELRLDRNDWTTEQKEDFARQLSGCKVTYEKVVDRQYWHLLPAVESNH